MASPLDRANPFPRESLDMIFGANKDADYTYYPRFHPEGEFAFEDENGIAYYRVPNSKVGIEGLYNGFKGIMGNIGNDIADEARGYYDWFQDPNKFADERQGLENMAQGAKNIYNRSRAFANEIVKKTSQDIGR